MTTRARWWQAVVGPTRPVTPRWRTDLSDRLRRQFREGPCSSQHGHDLYCLTNARKALVDFLGIWNAGGTGLYESSVFVVPELVVFVRPEKARIEAARCVRPRGLQHVLYAF
jgi:hypothetical protein